MTAPSRTGLPDKFRARLLDLVPPARLPNVLHSFALPKAPTFRINTLRTDDRALLAELQAVGVHPTPAPGLAHVYTATPDDRAALVRSPASAQGKLYVQNLSSLLAAPALDVAPGMRVLDLAAAPGGKTLHLAALMNNTGHISAVEPTTARYYRLRENLRLHGVTCCRTYRKDGRAVGRLCPAQFDRVLLDAPCSGEAQLRSDEADAPNWSERKIAQCAGKQRALLHAAVAACRPGGLIVYCTCSLAPEENEAVVSDVLVRHPGDLTLEAVPRPAVAEPAAVPGLTTWRHRTFPAELSAACRILPDERFEAFFLCRMRKH